jgi:2-polyprenyl-6-hydroxyphenyl methylase/3-demethylubiquinone-9 3-methyltransferase
MTPTDARLPVTAENVDPAELSRFGALAHRWWDPESDLFGPLHKINPLRLSWIDGIAGPLAGCRVVDVGCGGGILAEGMATLGADVLGIDLSPKSISVAKLHRLESGVAVDYRTASAEALAAEQPASFDVVTCMEMLEHVPDAGSVVRACVTLAKPGGRIVFSTINRNPKSYALAILGAEYVLNLLPRGTHDWSRFVRPAELASHARQAGAPVIGMIGIAYNPLTRTFRLAPGDVDVNYLAAFRRDA